LTRHAKTILREPVSDTSRSRENLPTLYLDYTLLFSAQNQSRIEAVDGEKGSRERLSVVFWIDCATRVKKRFWGVFECV
jgi:hypothetical protein